MNEIYKEKFKQMVSEYADKLSTRIVLNDSAFTLHDFEHHCFDIYKIISNVLFDQNLVYQDGYGLTQKELFILNLAVLFHDIGMSQVLGVARENHSVKSAEYIQKEYENSGALKTKTDLTVSEIKALKAIVIAHSDAEDDAAPGLHASALHDYSSKDETLIRTKFLAGVLRVADELDVSSERLGTGELENDIKEGLKHYNKLKSKANRTQAEETELLKWEGYSASLNHWKKLHLIEKVRRNKDGETIELCVDDEYIERCLDDGQTEKALARDIVEIYLKIKDRLTEAIKLCFSGDIFGKYVYVKKVRIITENEKLDKIIQDNISVSGLPREEANLQSKNSAIKKTIEHDIVPQVLNSELEEFVYNEVQKRGLIKFGHYLLDDIYCARDWIDTQEVVETKKILNKLVDAIVKDINSKERANNATIIGVDLVGALLASRVAFYLQRPLTYIIPEKEETNNSVQEKELFVDSKTEVIVITDAIVTFEMLHKAIEKHSLEDKINSIYTVFYRPNDKVKVNSPFLTKTFSINNMFKIELFEKSKCVYRKTKCIAQNSKMK